MYVAQKPNDRREVIVLRSNIIIIAFAIKSLLVKRLSYGLVKNRALSKLVLPIKEAVRKRC